MDLVIINFSKKNNNQTMKQSDCKKDKKTVGPICSSCVFYSSLSDFDKLRQGDYCQGRQLPADGCVLYRKK